MEKILLKVQTRKSAGKSTAKKLRRQGLIPAVVYKGGASATSLQLPVKDFEQVLHTKAGENVLITLKITGSERPVKDKTVIIKDIQHEPIKDGVLHVDFNEISLTETIKVNVPLTFKGEAVGVKDEGGVVDHVIRELHVECLPADIPEGIEVDVAALKIGDSIMVKDISVPAGITVLNEPDLIVTICKTPHVEKPPEEIPGEEAAEPELIRKEKKEEEVEDEGESRKEGAPKQEQKEKK